MSYTAVFVVTYEAYDSQDALHLADLMQDRLDSVTPESTKVNIKNVRVSDPSSFEEAA